VEAELEMLEGSSIHAAHEYRVQEADLADEVEACSVALLMNTVFRRLT
jgi:hypothetical protein